MKGQNPPPSGGWWVFRADLALLDSAFWEFKGPVSNPQLELKALGVLRNVREGEVRMEAV